MIWAIVSGVVEKEPIVMAKPIHVLYLEGADESGAPVKAVLFKNAPDLSLVGSVGSCEEALELCDELKPNVLLIEIDWLDASHINAIRVIRFHYPHVKVLVLTHVEDLDSVRIMLSVGVSGYLLKQFDLPELAASIRAVNSGTIVFSRAITRTLSQVNF